MTSEEFEKKIEWIESLLKRRKANVTWNERIPDPDNPQQKRQIDVTIRKGKHLTLVECRLHSRPQDVQWIEELHGRRVSLKAYSVIAVSSSGFTEGAIAKADRLGIVLRDFKSLTEDEVNRWGEATDLYLEYVYFFDTVIYPVIEPSNLHFVTSAHSIFQNPDGSPWPIDMMFKSVVGVLDKMKRPSGGIRIQIFPKNMIFGSRQMKEVIFQSNYKKKRVSVKLPIVSVYGAPDSIENKNMLVESQKVSSFEIYRYSDSVFVIVDLSIAPPMKGAIFKSVLFDFKRPVRMNGVKLIGQKLETFTMIPFKVNLIHKDSAMYHSLLSDNDSKLILPS